jgi:hypothetical protein
MAGQPLTTMQPDPIDVLIQWLFFFGLISILLVPAIIFRKIALKRNKKGWAFFLTGAGVGFVSLIIVRLLAFQLMKFKILESTENHIPVLILFLVLPGIMVTMAIVGFKYSMGDRD